MRISLILLAVISCASAAVTLPKDEAALEIRAEDTGVRRDWALNELERLLGGKEWNALVSGPRTKFFRELQGGLLEELMFSGPVPEDAAKMLRIAEALWTFDRAGLANRHELTTAAAVALMYAQKDWPEDQAEARYRYFRDSRKAGKLHPSFDALATWEKRFVVSAGGNGGWAGQGGWGEDSLVWLRDHVKLPVKDYTGACWQAPYRLENVFGDSIHGSNYYAPFDKMTHAERVRSVGGVCGSLSHYGATAARANGIPAITMGEPGHCAYAVRTARGEWTPAYSLSWERGLHTSLWGRTWTQLVLQEEVLGEKCAADRSSLHLWQARALKEKDPDLADKAYRLALKAQPLAHPAWLEYVAWLRDSRKLEPLQWKKVHDEVLAALSGYPEAAWEVIRIVETALMKDVPADERIPFLLSFHNAIAGKDGPVMWALPKALEEQVQHLGNPAAELEFFEQVVALHAGSGSWLAPVVAWGSGRWQGRLDRLVPGPRPRAFVRRRCRRIHPGGAPSRHPRRRGERKCRRLPIAGQSGRHRGRSPTSADGAFPRRTALRGRPDPAVDDLRLGFPESHAGVLELKGGRLHTAAEVRPHVIVKLAKLGELSGMVICDNSTGYNATRIIPLKASVSEDGQTWQEVFRTDKAGGPWRVALDGKAPRVAWVKIERDDDRKEVFHLSAIHVYGRKLQ